ncbi:MAG TPA: hypothetical protein VNL77_24835 [Roseiflexaceae bacterium]|nr:hypothetical protein [Roseiflexaceae bacterium]
MSATPDPERQACVPVALNASGLNQSAQLPYGLLVPNIRAAMEGFLDFLGFVNQQLNTRGIQRLESMLMPANFSSIVGEFMSSNRFAGRRSASSPAGWVS